jgi:predicted Zn-dependent peptidase
METLSYNVANNALKEVLKYKKVVTLQERLKDAEKVTNDDVIKFVKWAFDPEYIFTEIILPSKK